MEIRGVGEFTIRRVAQQINATCEHWRSTNLGFAFVLRPKHGSEMYRGLGRNGRRANAICWHGHKAFMDEIFKHMPEAVIISTLARYVGEEDYRRKLKNPDPRKGFQSTFNCSHGG